MSHAVTLVRGLVPTGAKQPIVWIKKADLPLAPYPGLTIQMALPSFVPGSDNPEAREALPVQALFYDAVKGEVVCALPPTELPAADVPKMEEFLRMTGWERHHPAQIVAPPPGLHLM